MTDDTPTVELPRCPSRGMPVEPGTCCAGCGVYFGDPCPACGQPGYHADGCAEIEEKP